MAQPRQCAGWQDLCTKFHRINPDTARNCTESDLYLSENLKPGEYIDYKCKNGLWDVVTPLFVGSKHLGNIYTGQFFYDGDLIDKKEFGHMVGVKCDELVNVPLDDVAQGPRLIPPDHPLVQSARSIGTSFGD